MQLGNEITYRIWGKTKKERETKKKGKKKAAANALKATFLCHSKHGKHIK